MKSKELQKKKDADLKKLVLEKKEALRELSFAQAGSTKSGAPARDIRKDIARIMTELSTRSKQVSPNEEK